MTLLEHVYALKNILAKGPISNSMGLSSRLIAHFLQVARARIIEQKIDKYHFISEQSYQDWCVRFELSNFHSCCEGPNLDCKVLRSTEPIPKFLNSRWGNYVKVMDMSGRVIPRLTMTQNRFSTYALVPVQEG